MLLIVVYRKENQCAATLARRCSFQLNSEVSLLCRVCYVHYIRRLMKFFWKAANVSAEF